MDIEKISNLGVKPNKVYSAVECIIGHGDCTVPGENGLNLYLKKEDV